MVAAAKQAFGKNSEEKQKREMEKEEEDRAKKKAEHLSDLS